MALQEGKLLATPKLPLSERASETLVVGREARLC